MFFVLLSFSESLAHVAKVWLNKMALFKWCMIRPTLIELNSIDLKCYPFMISLDKCIQSLNILSPKISVPKNTKYINVKAFDMITNKNEAKIRQEITRLWSNHNKLGWVPILMLKSSKLFFLLREAAQNILSLVSDGKKKKKNNCQWLKIKNNN